MCPTLAYPICTSLAVVRRVLSLARERGHGTCVAWKVKFLSSTATFIRCVLSAVTPSLSVSPRRSWKIARSTLNQTLSGRHTQLQVGVPCSRLSLLTTSLQPGPPKPNEKVKVAVAPSICPCCPQALLLLVVSSSRTFLFYIVLKYSRRHATL